jgi:hypothetical protein
MAVLNMPFEALDDYLLDMHGGAQRKWRFITPRFRIVGS